MVLNVKIEKYIKSKERANNVDNPIFLPNPPKSKLVGLWWLIIADTTYDTGSRIGISKLYCFFSFMPLLNKYKART